VNGGAASGGSAPANETATWSRAVSLVAGQNTITVAASDGANNVSTTTIVVTRTVPVTSVTLTSSLTSPRLTGTAITFTATSLGGSMPAQYKFLVQQSGGLTLVAQNWSTTRTFTWTPTVAASYTVIVWARSAGQSADAADALAQIPFAVNAALAIPSYTSTLSSPQNVNTSIGFNAVATGGLPPHQFKWWIYDGTTWSIAKNWSTSSSLMWQPSVAGRYIVAVWARNAGETADAGQALAQTRYEITVGVPTITSLTSSLPSPQGANSLVVFHAGSTGGVTPLQFKWWVYDGKVWSIAQDWSTDSSLAWQPRTPGAYIVAVWGRNAGVTADAGQTMAQVNYVVTVSSPLSVTSLTSNVPTPQIAGTSVSFNATATGGSAPYQFKWWVFNGVVWSVAQEWISSPSLQWRPTTPGTYTVAVWARSAGVTADAAEALSQVTYVIAPAETRPLTVTLSADLPSPQSGGVPISFTAAAAGGVAPHQFKWWVFDGITWSLAQNWSIGGTLTWRPTRAGNYIVAVWVRNAGVTADASQALAQVPFVVTP
jgi:hypothetical protein